MPIEEGAVEAEHRRVTAAFVKYSGTDELVERIDEATETLAQLADAVSAETEERRVMWLESDIDRNGGKLYLVAGAPASEGDEEERMLRALRAVVDAGVGPPISVGVNRGPVLAGPIGSDVPEDVRRDGRHRQSRGAALRARREGRDPRHRRRAPALPHPLRDRRRGSS